MKFNISKLNWIGVSSYVMAVLAMLSIYTILSGKKLPIIGDGKLAFVMLFLIGFSMSVLGGFRDYPDGKFIMPGLLMALLMILGLAAIILLIAMLIGIKIPFIPTYKEAIMVISGIIILKWILVHLYKIFNLFIK